MVFLIAEMVLMGSGDVVVVSSWSAVLIGVDLGE